MLSMKNKYIIRSRISEAKFRSILRLFCLDIQAKKVSKLTNVSRYTINKIFDKLRLLIAQKCEEESPFNQGEIELDESYFGAKRVRGKRGRGSGGKVPVFGMLKREGKVYTQIVKNCSSSVIMPIIESRASKESTIYTDGFKSYDGLVNYGYKRHYRVKHSENEFAKGVNHINGIENFWGLCKVRLSRFRGVHKHKFYYHLKECEWRFNYRNENLYFCLLKWIRKNPLKLS
ncbi:IS1595 family transposase [Ichthyobacterium seriolicida]|uniref:Transposase n=1 Tax=Ichthyobacterium seriolicida TaxID=242600 RepID=A0A1J1E764_9FLAO|nr:IS1595 family transposase [Ichthyobacterium seriolicida]BAV95182.1 transposase [Ichthyobacterium seriolicida]